MGANMHDYVIHIIQAHAWAAIGYYGAGYFERKDGNDFMHFSYPHQVVESAMLHFQDDDKLMLLVCKAEKFGDKLKTEWVKKRKEQMPHLYAPHFNVGDIAFRTTMERDASGNFAFPDALDAFLKSA